MSTAIAVVQDNKLANYGDREELQEMTDRLLGLHPAAGEVGKEGMRAVAQLAILVGASPLPSTNEIHVWNDNKKGLTINLGINYYRRMAQQWGGVLWDIQPRQMNEKERQEYGVPNGMLAAICRAATAKDMEKWIKMKLTPNQIYDMCGRVGVATVNNKDYAKNGRPLVWTALKRAEIDLYRQLFPVQMASTEPKANQVQVSSVEPASESLDDFNASLFGDVDTSAETIREAREAQVIDGDFTEIYEDEEVAQTPLLDYDGWVEQASEAKSADVFCLSMFKAFQTLPYSPFKAAVGVKNAVKAIKGDGGEKTNASAMIKALEIYVDSRANDAAHDDAHGVAVKKYADLTGVIEQAPLFDEAAPAEQIRTGNGALEAE